MLYIGIRLCLSISFLHLDVFILCPVDSITACCTPRLRTSLLRTTTRLVGARLVYYLKYCLSCSYCHYYCSYGLSLYCLPLLNLCPWHIAIWPGIHHTDDFAPFCFTTLKCNLIKFNLEINWIKSLYFFYLFKNWHFVIPNLKTLS